MIDKTTEGNWTVVNNVDTTKAGRHTVTYTHKTPTTAINSNTAHTKVNHPGKGHATIKYN